MAAAGKEAEAQRLLAEADKKVRGAQSFLGGLFGGSSRLEEACECYTRAANMFKMAKNWSQAGAAFSRAAQLQLQLQSKHDAATNLVDAGNAFRKADPQGERRESRESREFREFRGPGGWEPSKFLLEFCRTLVTSPKNPAEILADPVKIPLKSH
ncbi:PREDICTED: alpha-soluble NSF attachment protein-like [Sturnus vulgaris]|uniref:alpha-soluble NSF attachment protein-like n=1 Tax=Sturnus vulgaris TaxID=9172 RepID=UPI00071A8D05|nr:PREDICTED: alpha-soluble NSF attachment protein-like [Sturnus vulgaris]